MKENFFEGHVDFREAEVFCEEVNLGTLKIQLSVQKATSPILNAEEFTLYLTAKDVHNRTLWSTPIIDSHIGRKKLYASIAEAIADAKRKLGIYLDRENA